MSSSLTSSTSWIGRAPGVVSAANGRSWGDVSETGWLVASAFAATVAAFATAAGVGLAAVRGVTPGSGVGRVGAGVDGGGLGRLGGDAGGGVGRVGGAGGVGVVRIGPLGGLVASRGTDGIRPVVLGGGGVRFAATSSPPSGVSFPDAAESDGSRVTGPRSSVDRIGPSLVPDATESAAGRAGTG